MHTAGQHHIDDRISREHEVGLALADNGAAANATNREQHKTIPPSIVAAFAGVTSASSQ